LYFISEEEKGGQNKNFMSLNTDAECFKPENEQFSSTKIIFNCTSEASTLQKPMGVSDPLIM